MGNSSHFTITLICSGNLVLQIFLNFFDIFYVTTAEILREPTENVAIYTDYLWKYIFVQKIRLTNYREVGY